MLSSHLYTQSFFAERFFHIFDKDKTEHISRKELKDGLLLLTSGSEVDKLRFLFQIYDIDGIILRDIYICRKSSTRIIILKVVDIFSLKSCAQCSNPAWERVPFSSVTIS